MFMQNIAHLSYMRFLSCIGLSAAAESVFVDWSHCCDGSDKIKICLYFYCVCLELK